MEARNGAAALAPAHGTGTSHHKPAAAVASAATAYGGGQMSWALLDPEVILKEDKHLAADSSAVVCTASNGSKVRVRVSLDLSEPPASSYVKLRTDADIHVKPVLLSADGHMLLMRMVVARVRDPPFTSYEDNYFVYKVRPDPDSGKKEGRRLWLLPDPQQSTDDRDDYVGHVGIACTSCSRGKDDDWVVAGFHTRVVFGHGDGVDDNEVGILSRCWSSSKKWDKLVDLPIPFDDKNGLYKFVWHSDDVVAFQGKMFWIDYHRGMIYCDVFAKNPKLQYIPLPGIDFWDQDHDYSKGRQLPRAYRTVGVSRGQLKFIDIDDGLFGTKKASGFKITIWSLKMTTDLEWWVNDNVLEVDLIWSSLPNFRDSPLPRWYPVVDKKHTGILHFIVRGRQSDAPPSTITLDMSSKALMKSSEAFKNKLKPLFEDPSVGATQIFCDAPLISCDFDHLTKPTGDKTTEEFPSEETLTSDVIDGPPIEQSQGSCAHSNEEKSTASFPSTSKSKKHKPPSLPDKSDRRKKQKVVGRPKDPSGTTLMPSSLRRIRTALGSSCRPPVTKMHPSTPPEDTIQTANDDTSLERHFNNFTKKVLHKQDSPLIREPPKQPSPKPMMPWRSRRLAAQSLSCVPASKRGEVLIMQRMGYIKGPSKPSTSVVEAYDSLFDGLTTSEAKAMDTLLFPVGKGPSKHKATS